ncbi:MAG: flagellar basal body-associated FliL family protein [Hyphomicrobiales bacterium]
MSDEAKTEDTKAGEAAAEGKPRKRIALKLPANSKKLILYVIPVLLLMGGAAYALTSMDLLPSFGSKQAPARTAKVYYDMPEMVVNLSASEKRAHYLKLKVALEASDQVTIDSLMPVMPRILDMFQLYLREMRSSDLEGSAGIYRLKEELLRRVNLEIHPKQIDRVLFKEIIVQ